MPTISTELIKDKIAEYHHKIEALNALLNGVDLASHRTEAATPQLKGVELAAHETAEIKSPGKTKRRQLSLAQRKNMQEAQRARWAKKRAAEAAPAAPITPTPIAEATKAKKVFSAATRKRLSLAQKKYWADKKTVAAVVTGKKGKGKALVAGASA